MKSTAQIQGHPIHPMLIPYPFALLSTATLFDLGARLTGQRAWSETGKHLTAVGIGTAFIAAVPGIVDYFGTVPPRTTARRSATQHALCNVSALVCFALATARRLPDGCPGSSGLTLSVLGTGLLAVGGWLGGHLIYHERIGVTDDRGTPFHLLSTGR
jgi:uncharacterized membrane protein